MRITAEADSKQARLRMALRLDDNHGLTVLTNNADEPQIELKVGKTLAQRFDTLFATTQNGSDGSPAIIVQTPDRITMTINQFNLPVIAPMNNLADTKAVQEAVHSLSLHAKVTAQGGRITFPSSYLDINALKSESQSALVNTLTASISTDNLSNEVNLQVRATGALTPENEKQFTIDFPAQITSPLDPAQRESRARLVVTGLMDSTIQTNLVMKENKTGCRITADGQLDITPTFAKQFLANESTISLDDNTTLRFTFQPIGLNRLSNTNNTNTPGPINFNELTNSAAVGLHLDLDNLTARGVSDFPHAVAINNTSIDAHWPAGVTGIPEEFTITATIYDADTKNKIASLNGNANTPQDSAPNASNILRIDLTDINTTNLESLLGYDPQTLSDLTGEGGEVIIEADVATLMDLTKGKPNQRALHIVGKFPRFTADVSGRMNETADRFVLDPGGAVQFEIPKQSAERMLARMYETDESKNTSNNRILVNDDIQVSLNIREASVRADILNNINTDSLTKSAKLDSELTLSPFHLQAAQDSQPFDQFTLQDTRIALQSQDGDDAVAFAVSALIRNREESPVLLRELLLGAHDSPDGNSTNAPDEVGNLVNTLLGKNENTGNSRNTPVTNQDKSEIDTSTKTPEILNPNGEIQLTGTVTNPLSPQKISENTPSWLIHNLSGKFDHLPVPFLDILADSSGTLTAALGSSLNADIKAEQFGPGQGALSIAMTSETGNLHINSAEYLADGTIRIGAESGIKSQQQPGKIINTNSPMFASLDLTPDMAHSILDNISPMFYDIRKKTGPITLSAQYLHLPTDGDLAKLDADLILDLGQIDMSSGGLFGDLLGTAKKKVGDSTTATLQPIPISIRQGIVNYDNFEIQADTFKVTTGGKINLVTQQLDLTAAVPLIGWQSTFGQLTGALKNPVTDWNIPFYLIVKGTIDDPKIKPDPKGAQRVADELFKKTIDDTVGNIFNQLLNNKKKDKNKKKKKGGGGV